MSNSGAWLAAGVLACAAAAGAANVTPPAPVAQSPLVSLAAEGSAAGFTLELRRTAGTAPLVVTALTVSVDGERLPATRNADGSWSVAWPRAGAHRPGHLEVVAAHDGIRELLSGTLPASATAGPGGGGASGTGGASSASGAGGASSSGPAGLWRAHKQLAWWVLNIGVVLIAAIALSRRMS